MCGRFALTEDWSQIIANYNIIVSTYTDNPRYNIAPTQMITSVIEDNNKNRRVGQLQWGIVPRAWGKRNTKVKPINARVEALKENRTFQRLVERKRCIIPASGYFEWHKETKVPYFIRVKGQTVFSLAGFYDTWVTPEGTRLSTCAILTCAANNHIKDIHERMPVILNGRSAEKMWLDRSERRFNVIREVLTPYSETNISCYEVSKLVGNVRNDCPECIRPLA